MRQLRTCLFFSSLMVQSGLLFGVSAKSTRDEISRYHVNTPIRVLLDKGSQEVRARSVTNEMYAKDDGVGGWIKFGKQILITPARKQNGVLINNIPFEGNAVYLRGGPHPSDKLQFLTEVYRGALKATLTPKGLVVTNVIPLEEYLHGMLGGEMSPSWDAEALKAQAVASRTYAMYMMNHPKSKLFDLERGTSDQVYIGADGESERARRAIEETRGQYLTLNAKPIKSYYHSRCGGTTETAKNVWNFTDKGNQKRVPCPYCQKFPFAWKSLVKAQDLFRSLRLPFSEPSSFKLLLADKSPSGRINSLKLESGGKERQINSDELRSVVGYTRIKSTHFDWKIQGKEIEFFGVGSGHGVGMCQWGARFLAQQGKNYRQILAHYYPGVDFHLEKPPK